MQGLPTISKIQEKYSEEDPHSLPKEIQDNFQTLLKSDDEYDEEDEEEQQCQDCLGFPEEQKVCHSVHRSKNYYDPSISNISSMSTFNNTTEGDASNNHFKQFSVKSQASSFQYKSHTGFKSPSDFDTASNYSGGAFRNQNAYSHASISSLSSSKLGYYPPLDQDYIQTRKKTYHPGFTSNYQPLNYCKEGNHSIQFLQAQQNQVFDQGLIVRRKSNSLFTPHFCQMQQQQYYNFGMPNNAMMQSQEKVIFAIQKRLEDLEGSAQGFGDDQQSCRFLQDQLEKNDPKLQNLIKEKVIPNFRKLMAQKFGNYLCQKIIQISSSVEILEIIQNVLISAQNLLFYQIEQNLIAISTNNFGTRAVQKLIQVLYQYPQAISRFQKAIDEQKLIQLIKVKNTLRKFKNQDNHGNHVVQQCLAKFPSTMTIFIFKTIIPNCIQLAQHRQGNILCYYKYQNIGCCVVQKCLEYGYQDDRLRLIAKLIQFCEILIPDQFGNYVLQHIIEKNLATEEQLTKIFNFVIPKTHELAKKKFSSNFIQKLNQCLMHSKPQIKQKLFSIICDDKVSKDLLLDKFGNYVFQTALNYTSNQFYQKLKCTAMKYMYELKRKDFGRPVLTKLYKTLGLNQSYFPPQPKSQLSNKLIKFYQNLEDIAFKKWQPKSDYYSQY